jgi:phage terminase large subunit-like protein
MSQTPSKSPQNLQDYLRTLPPDQVKALLQKLKPSPTVIGKLPEKEGDELLKHLEAIEEHNKYNKLNTLYPETGPLRRELYPKHIQFFAAGNIHRERAAVAANRIGKSFGIGGYETALHLTGKYPEWWCGKKFRRPTDIWAASDTSETTRDIVQQIMLGDIGDFGTGLIPKDCLLGTPTHRAGVPGAVDTVRVRHVSGGTSTLGFKCFVKGTKVLLADGQTISIENVNTSHIVKCADGSTASVVNTFFYQDAPCVEIITALNGSITVTPNHKMFTKWGKVEADKLCIDDELEVYNPDGNWLDQITRISIAPVQDVYCVEVAFANELIANGYRVSNSFDQGRKKFQGTAKDVCWLDESPPLDVYTECLTRLMTRDGILMCTFTPLEGLSDVVLLFLPEYAPNVTDMNSIKNLEDEE